MTKTAALFKPLPHAQRVVVARKLGTEAANAAEFRASEEAPEFRARALQFIKDFVAAQTGPVAGEDITLAARQAGIRQKDDRAFGAIYSKAIRMGYIRVVGHCNRVRGHGTAGGRLYAPVAA